MLKKYLHLLALLLLVLNMSACGIIDYFYLPPGEDTAQELFENGNDSMREKDYVKAAEYYTKLKEAYPFSPYTKEAELSLGDAYFLDNEYLLASEAYKDFEAMHPRDEAIPYALLQIAQSDINSYTSIDRPTTQLVEAEAYLSRIMQSFPGTEYAEKAKEMLAQCRRTMAEHELYLADFFMRTGRYGAAWKRYEGLSEKYSDVEDIAAHSKEKSKEAYVKYLEMSAKDEKELQNDSMFQRFKNWL